MRTPDAPITKTLCQTVVSTTFDVLPRQGVEIAKRIILDGVAVAVAGASEEGPRIVAAPAKSLGGTESSTVLGHGFKTSPVSAAYVNGISMHVLDSEPMWSPPTHATSPTLPVVLALAETEQASGQEVITAFVKACEIQGGFVWRHGTRRENSSITRPASSASWGQPSPPHTSSHSDKSSCRTRSVLPRHGPEG